MPTYIYDKKDFIEFIGKQVKDDEVIVFTNEQTGTLSFSKKKGTITQMQFAPESLTEEGVGHIAFGDTLVLGIMIVKQDQLSEKGMSAYKNIKQS